MQQSARLLEGFRPPLKQTVIALWYPLFADHRESGYVEGLRSHPGMGTWTSELHLTCTSNGKLRGSGMLLVNAPQGVRAEAETDGVILAERLDGEMRYWRPS
jgi:23S rRNA A2030 N6-methylase RlmJ